MTETESADLVVCVNNEGYAACLERRIIYLALHDATAEQSGLLRVVDESGEDYLYPQYFFRPIELPSEIKKAVLAPV